MKDSSAAVIIVCVIFLFILLMCSQPAPIEPELSSEGSVETVAYTPKSIMTMTPSNLTFYFWPGETTTETSSIVSIENVTLSFTTFGWQPVEAAEYITLTWNYTGTVISETPTGITWFLHVSQDFPEDIEVVAWTVLIKGEPA